MKEVHIPPQVSEIKDAAPPKIKTAILSPLNFVEQDK
jgi:hypothetical protein